MVKIPKREFGEKVVNAGQYMLKELYQRIEQALESIPTEKKKEETARTETALVKKGQQEEERFSIYLSVQNILIL